MSPKQAPTILNTDPPSATVNALLALYNGHRYTEAESQTRALLKQYPNFGFGWKLLGNILQRQGKDALSVLQQAAQLQPADAELYNALGNVFHDQGRQEDAIHSYRQALTLKTDFADAHNNLGIALKDRGQLNEAALCYRQALQFKPDFILAHYNLGNVCKALGQADDALYHYRQAIKLKPDFVEAHTNLGTVFKEQGDFQQAQASYRRVLQLKPGFAEAHNNLGAVLKDLGQLDAALLSYRKALELKPHYADAYNNLGTVLQALGQPAAALSSYLRAAELQPEVLLHPLYAHLLLPVIPDSAASITYWRQRYQNGIAALLSTPGTLEEPGDKLGSVSFYLAYHNANDRPLMEALCRLFRACVPSLTYTAPHVPGWHHPKENGQRIRVGFLSEFLFDHTIGKHYQGFIRHLDRKRFEVVVIHAHKSRRDAFRDNLDALADKAITLPVRLSNQQQAVAAEQLDVLFYPDIGMASATYFLAFARLAPVQLTSWGHPDTSGLDTMDYYLSAASNEPDHAEANYTEKLIRLNRLPCFYHQTKPQIPALSKEALGLPPSGTLYGCPQNLFKLHPDFDAVLAAIATGDPSGHLLLPEGKYPAWTELLKARWAKTYPILLERVIFLPRMSWDRFMAVLAQMDVLLDPLHFGSGNTLYDAMVTGTPVVTWPGQFARGRNVAAAYRQMELADAPIASSIEEYAALALALGGDPSRRHALRVASLESASRDLFEDMQAVREFENFLQAAVEIAGQGSVLSDWQPANSAV
jgi:protein O-GlcNAc transferase